MSKPRLAVGAVLTGVLVTGCGSGGAPPEETLAALRAARQQAVEAGSARIEVTISSPVLSSYAQGVLAWRDGVRGTATVRVTGGSEAGPTRRMGGDPSQARYLPDAYYTRMSDAFAARNQGRHWVRSPYVDTTNPSPGGFLRTLLDSGTARPAGAQTVGGVRTTRYTGRIGGHRVEVWLDTGRMPVQRRLSTGDFSSTIRYRDFGTPVAVHRPPAHDSVDLAEVSEGVSGPITEG